MRAFLLSIVCILSTVFSSYACGTHLELFQSGSDVSCYAEDLPYPGGYNIYSWHFSDGATYDTDTSNYTFHSFFSAAPYWVSVEVDFYDASGSFICTATDADTLSESACSSVHPGMSWHYSSGMLNLTDVSTHAAGDSILYSVWSTCDASAPYAFVQIGTNATVALSPGIYDLEHAVLMNSGCYVDSCFTVNLLLPGQDLQLALYHNVVHPSQTNSVTLSYANMGSTSVYPASVLYQYDPHLSFSSSSPSPVFHDETHHLLKFDLDTMQSAEAGEIHFSLNSDASLDLNSVLHDSAWILPLTGELNLSNNSTSSSIMVLAPLAPNGIQVSPAGSGLDHSIPAETQTLYFDIQFQNAYPATAHQLILRDRIDPSLNIYSIQLAGSSQACDWQVDADGVLTVLFPDIDLSDASLDPLHAGGCFDFRIDLNEAVAAGTAISNQAELYFDYHPVVLTNTVSLKLSGESTAIPSEFKQALAVFPNPSADYLFLSWPGETQTASIVDANGKECMKWNLKNGLNSISIQSLPEGNYFLSVDGSTYQRTGFVRVR